MIEISKLCKTFDDTQAIRNLDLVVRERELFGLIGTNGAGKSTLMRLIAGIFKADSGSITVDGERAYENPRAKRMVFFITDDPYFFPNATPGKMAEYYRAIYPDFDVPRAMSLMEGLGLDTGRAIAGFSKGMKKQTALILGICSGTRYLLCDETFDGLDPVMRQAAKSMLAADMESRGLTPVLTSHNLRELEDVCDHVGLLHRGGVLLSRDLNEMKLGISKVQCVFPSDEEMEKAERLMGDILIHNSRGRLHSYTVRSSAEALDNIFRYLDTVFYEILPLTLEEIFISETEVAGYDIKSLLFE
ncbi:MAG: ABC transporter ATP-binding protein [Lachnospiraceae bacterium]|nr:ABC transporter ATP-binding protein [Lachnospiraceae bacterium]